MAQTFDAQSSTDEVLAGWRLEGRRVLVTGVSAGLGVETARALAAHGAEVVGTARDPAKAGRALAEAGQGDRQGGGQGDGNESVEVVELDLASLGNVRRCADALVARGQPLDLIVANAGVMATPFGHTSDGFETQFGTNHLGHFVLVNRLAPLLREGGRVVSLSSAGHRFSDVDLDDPGFERTPYEPFLAYGRSKTANILFAVEFDRRNRARGVRATAVHPGGIQTELGRYMQPEAVRQMAERIEGINREFAAQGLPPFRYKSVPQGAATSVWAGVVAPADEVGGRYCEDCHVGTVVTPDQPISVASGGVRAYALDGERAEALWARSEQLVGERF